MNIYILMVIFQVTAVLGLTIIYHLDRETIRRIRRKLGFGNIVKRRDKNPDFPN